MGSLHDWPVAVETARSASGLRQVGDHEHRSLSRPTRAGNQPSNDRLLCMPQPWRNTSSQDMPAVNGCMRCGRVLATPSGSLGESISRSRALPHLLKPRFTRAFSFCSRAPRRSISPVAGRKHLTETEWNAVPSSAKIRRRVDLSNSGRRPRVDSRQKRVSMLVAGLLVRPVRMRADEHPLRYWPIAVVCLLQKR